MDDQTKQQLVSICQILRETADNAFHAHEMAWRTYAALAELNLPKFLETYPNPKGVSFDEMIGSRQTLLEQLDEAIRKLQE